MRSNKSQAPRRRSDIWALWRKHLEAQRASGQSQVSYCREHDLDSQYFSVWKRKLLQAHEAPGKPSLQLVPLVIKDDAVGECRSARALLIHLRLVSGLSVSIEVPVIDALRRVLAELAGVSC